MSRGRSRHEFDRQLEVFRGQQALSTEVAKRQILAMGEVWSRIAEYEQRLFDQSRDLAVAYLTELRAAGYPGVPDVAPKGAKAALEAVAHFGEAELPPEAGERLEAIALARRTAVVAEAERIHALLREKRFWLGAEIETELRGYLDEMTRAFSELSPDITDRRAFAEALRGLIVKRLTAIGLIRKLYPTDATRAQ